MVQIVHASRAAVTGGSGLTGPVDQEDADLAAAPGPAAAAPRGLRAVGATVVGLGRVLALVWRAGPLLTALLALATVVAGLVPAAVAVTGRLLVNTVVRAVELRVRHLPDRVPLALPLPWGQARLPGMSSAGAIVVLAGAQFAIYAVSTGCGALRNITQQLLQEKAAQSVQLRVMHHAGRLGLPFFEGPDSYDLLRQAQQEAATRPVTMIGGAFGLVQTVITFVGMAALLIGLSPWLALVALVAPVPAFVSDSRYGMRGFLLAQWSSPVRRRMEYLSRLVTTDTFAKEVKVFGLAPYLTDRFRLLGAAAYARLRSVVTRRYLAGAAWSSLTVLAGSLTYLYVALAAVHGRLSLGDLTLYTAAATALQGAIQGIFQGLTGMFENNLYLSKLYELLAVDTQEADAQQRGTEEPLPLPSPLRGEVVFENVSFRYPGSEAWALRDVSFTLAPGQTLAVVGRNGAGKSTLIKLLCRLYDPAQGRILLDGTDIRRLDPDALRGQVAALFQDFVRYQATAAENIGLGEVSRLEDRPAVEDAARRAGADALLEALPAGYDTPLGKWFAAGVELSGGEWQKVALARAFLRETPLLVLDEPTSALDAEAEHALFARLRELARGRTTVYISHRFSTVREADTILVLEDGRVAEQGTHPELMALRGRYARLFALQAEAYLGPATSDAAPSGPDAVRAAKIAAALAARGLGESGG